MQFQLKKNVTTLLLAGMLAVGAHAGGEGWTDNYEGAQTTATAEGKDLLLDFTGSDWCGWCIRLNEEVFNHDVFNDYADENFVLVELDFPAQKELAQEVVEQNAQLQEKFQVQGFPTIVLTDAQGLPYAQTGYQEGGAEAYIAHLEELRAKRVTRDENIAAADETFGDERAHLLHNAMQAVGDDLALRFYGELVDEIIELDVNNASGLQAHYQSLLLSAEQRSLLEEAMNAQDPQTIINNLQTLLENEELTNGIRQEALAMISQVYMFGLNDAETAEPLLREAIAVDPDSELGVMLQGALEQFFPAE